MWRHSPSAYAIPILHFGGCFCELDSFDDHPFFGPVDVTYNLTVTDDEDS